MPAKTQNQLLDLGDKLDLRLRPAQSKLLLAHRFEPEEPAAYVINRQLRRLAIAHQEGTAPPPVTGVSYLGTKSDRYSFSSEKWVVEPFIRQIQAERQLSKTQDILEFLVLWSCEFPKAKTLRTRFELYHYLVRRHGRGATGIELRSTLTELIDYCAVSKARQWLWELHQDFKIVLRMPQAGLTSRLIVHLPNSQGRMYYCFDLL